MRRRATRRAAFLALAALALLLPGAARAAFDYAPTPSTGPIGGPFYRHLAHDFGLDIRELAKLERRGFGREEVVTLVLISSSTGVNVKEYAKRRLKDQVLLKDLAAEAKMDYPTLLHRAREIKTDIEKRGENNLPPPVFEPSPTPEARRKKKKDASPVPTPSGAPVPSPSPSLTAMPAPSPTPTLPVPAPAPVEKK